MSFAAVVLGCTRDLGERHAIPSVPERTKEQVSLRFESNRLPHLTQSIEVPHHPQFPIPLRYFLVSGMYIIRENFLSATNSNYLLVLMGNFAFCIFILGGVTEGHYM